jgi:hypothetical protein
MHLTATLRAVCLAFTLTFVALAPAFAGGGTADSILANAKLGPLAEPNFNRPGQDYKNFELDSNANTCESACAGDRKCKAWTYVKPGVQGERARCWLKRGAPPLQSNSCCISGLKAGICDSGSYWDKNARECRPRVN